MPHSGGGGSHSGGSHSSGGGSGSSRRVSHQYFPGAHRYVYYYDNKPDIYYSTSRDGNPRSNGWALLIFGCLWTAVSLMIFSLTVKYSPGGPLPLNYDTDIVIQDELGIIEDEAVLRQRFSDFQKETGITFAVMVCTPDAADMDRDCTEQSYGAYVSAWQDESHWLVYYLGSTADRNDDWQWNLMCGDDCTRILGNKEEEAFTDNFHQGLLSESSFDSALLSAVDRLNPDLSGGIVYRHNAHVNGRYVGGQRVEVVGFAFFGLFMLAGAMVCIVGVCGVLTPEDSEKMARCRAIRTMDATSPLEEASCGYCGSPYYVGTVSACPFCGTPISSATTAER